jgi:hypothetical protein
MTEGRFAFGSFRPLRDPVSSPYQTLIFKKRLMVVVVPPIMGILRWSRGCSASVRRKSKLATAGDNLGERRKKCGTMLTIEGKPAFRKTRGWTAGTGVSSPLFLGVVQLFPQVNESGDGRALIPRAVAAAAPFNLPERVLHSPLGMR